MEYALTIIKWKPLIQVALFDRAWGLINCFYYILWHLKWRARSSRLAEVSPGISEKLAEVCGCIVNCDGQIKVRPAGGIA